MSGSEFEGHEALIAQMRAGTLDAPGHLHRRVLAGAPARRRRLAAMSARQRFYVALPVAASLAVGAAVVHGVFFSSTSSLRPAPSAPVFSPASHSQSAGRALGATGATGSNGATGARGPAG